VNDRSAGPSKLVTCILPKGKGVSVVRALKDEKALFGAHVNSARGTGRMTHWTERKQMAETEKDVLTVIVPKEREDEIFAYIYETAGIGQAHGGLMYLTSLSTASVFTLPDLPDEV